MKKGVSLMLVLIMLFSSLCVGANAADAVPEQAYGKVETQDGRIVLTDDELKEKFGIEKILLPDGFEPVAYVYYNGMCDGELPEYLTFVFDDGTSVEIKESNSLYSYNGDIRISAFGFLLKSGSGLQFDVYVSSECSKTFRIDCEIKKMSFADNLKKYIKLMVLYNVSFLSNTDPHGVFIFPVEEIITGDPYIDAILNIFNYLPHDFLKDVIDETSLFVNYYSKELFSNT